METIALATAEVTPQKVTTDYRVIYLLLDWEQARIAVHVRGTNGERKEFLYEGVTATTMMTNLNKADLSVKSLHRRIMERLIADGHIQGAVIGVPD